MQCLKEIVRNNFIEEALREFNKCGFKGASVRRIALNSGTSVGNFYKYFQSKEDLFENTIGSVYNKLIDYINKFNQVELNEETDQVFFELMDKIMEIFKENSLELTILLNKSEDSRYHNCKKTFADFITRIVTAKFEYQLSLQGKRLNNNFIISLISYNLIQSIGVILCEKKNGEEVRKLILDIIDILYSNIESKLEIE